MDGCSTLPDENTQARCNGDEFACVGVKHEAVDKNSRYASINAGVRGLRGAFML